MTTTETLLTIELFERNYGPAKCALIYNSAWQLLLATMLSAQCKDSTVNKVTAKLFALFPTIEDIDQLPVVELEKLIYATGFYHNKAKNIKAAAKHLLSKHNGEVPNNMFDLLAIPGVARKTANVVLWEWFKSDGGIVVDTHVKRIANRLGWVKETNPIKIEKLLMELLPPSKWGEISLLLIEHGRQICDAKRPKCEQCFLQNYCHYYKNLKQNQSEV